jgi:hypothetical protein
VWEFSTRHLADRPSCIAQEQPGFQVYRHDGQRWQSAAIEDALDVGDRLPIFYVHGNFMERNNARQRALIVERYLERRADRPFRLIMLSWPSQREHPFLHDVYDNAASAECQSLYMAWLLERLGHVPEISLFGFSFGSRTVTGGLHLVSGGNIRSLNHIPLASSEEILSRYRVGLVAPAVDRNWLSPRGNHREALDRVDALVNLYNSRDPVLRRFRFIDRITRPVAAGFTGFIGVESLSNPRSLEPLDAHVRITQFDCGSRVGSTHDERSYYSECPYFGRMIDNLLWKDGVETCISQ